MNMHDMISRRSRMLIAGAVVAGLMVLAFVVGSCVVAGREDEGSERAFALLVCRRAEQRELAALLAGVERGMAGDGDCGA
jgi:hypothetical protein